MAENNSIKTERKEAMPIEKNVQLNQSLTDATKQSALKQLEDAKLRRDYEAAVSLLDPIPSEIKSTYGRMCVVKGGGAHEEVL